MRLRSISIFTADLPLASPFQHASSGYVDSLAEVVVKIETAEGQIGWGEVRGNAPYVTGDSQGKIVAALRDLFAPRLLSLPEVQPATVGKALDVVAPGSQASKAVLEIAVHDAAAKSLGVPLCDLLGGGKGAIGIHGTIPFCSADEAARRATAYLEKGIRTIKVRAGLRPFQCDLDRFDAVRQAVAGRHGAGEVKLALDANGSWDVKEAIRNLRKLEEFDLSWAEQPVAAKDFSGLKDVREKVAQPIMADESCGEPADMLRLICMRAADGFHLKLVKAGEIRKLLAMAAIAEAADLTYMIGQMDEGKLATAAALHCAVVSAPVSCELWGYQRVAVQPFDGIEMISGKIELSDRPGLGVEVDEAALKLICRCEPVR